MGSHVHRATRKLHLGGKTEAGPRDCRASQKGKSPGELAVAGQASDDGGWTFVQQGSWESGRCLDIFTGSAHGIC